MKRESDNYRNAETSLLVLVVTIVAWISAPTFSAQSDILSDQNIVPNMEIQSYLRSLISTNRQLMFDGTEESLADRLKTLRKMAGQDKDLVLQLMYFSVHHSKDEREVWLPAFIINQLSISNAIFADACLPLLDSNDETTKITVSEWLTRADYIPQGGVDFSRYEAILREKKQNPPQGLIRYMYDRDPQAAVVTVARVYGPDVPESEVAAKAKSGVKESVDYFSGRSEWWAHLYVAAMIEKEPYLRTPEMVKKIEQDTDPMVREKVSKLKDKLQPK